ncbi:5826_t:CDS:1 [Entrophospora sp. SA101]|nr:5826_t:CDS:1 [Entrophospora sp. SA101]
MSHNPVIPKLQEPMPVPQYIAGLIPVIVILGASPVERLIFKLIWVLRCLGCPFTGLFHNLVIGYDPVEMCMYWLPENFFVTTKEKNIDFHPVGLHAKNLLITLEQEKIMNQCTAKAPVMDRLSSLVSAYYIIVGIISATSSMTGLCTPEDWPSLTLSFLWLTPIIFGRTLITGILVVKDPKKELEDHLIRVLEENGGIKDIKYESAEWGEKLIPKQFDKRRKRSMFIITTLLSVVLPWVSVVMAFFTPPIGFFCRSKFLTGLCSLWTFNSLLECIYHINFGYGFLKGKMTKKIIHVYFVSSGIIITGFLILLIVLNNESQLWVKLFGDECSTSPCISGD